MTQSKNDFNFDNSALSRAKKTVSDLEERLDVMARRAEIEGRYGDLDGSVHVCRSSSRHREGSRRAVWPVGISSCTRRQATRASERIPAILKSKVRSNFALRKQEGPYVSFAPQRGAKVDERTLPAGVLPEYSRFRPIRSAPRPRLPHPPDSEGRRRGENGGRTQFVFGYAGTKDQRFS